MAITKKDIASPKDIIAYFVSKLNNWINVAGVDDLGNNQWKILTCNTKWAQKGFTIPNIGKIIDVDFNNYITVESETEILVENFELYPVKFIHGTAIQVNIENFTGENSLDPKLRLPVIYLREFTEMTRQSKWSNNLIRIEIPLTLYFLTKGNHDEWKTSDAYNEAIYPMKNLVDEFQKVLYKEKGNVGEWKEDTLNFHPKFGVRYVKKQNSDIKGVEVNYFDDNLTGVECAINLPLKIDFCNRCKDYVPPIPIESVSLFVNENLFKVYTTSPANLAIRNSLNQYVGTLDPDNGLVLIADSVITNDPTTPTYTQAVKATENLVLPAQNILVNTVNEGVINSVGDIEIVTNTPPSTIDVTGRTITLDFPPSEFDVNLVDRFGNNLGTKKVSANANWDLRTLTPFDWADLFLSRETAWGVSGFIPNTDAENAVTNLVDDLFSSGLWELMHGVYPLVGGTAAKHKWNLRYPFDNDNSLRLNFLNSPTHDWEGIKFNSGTTVNAFCCAITDNPSNLGINGFGHFSVYYRAYTPQNNNIDLQVLGDSRMVYWHLDDPKAGSGTLRMSWCGPVYQVNPSPALILTGHWTLNRPNSSNIRQIRNGAVERNVSGNNSTAAFFDGQNVYQNFRWGSGNKTMSAFTLGKGLTPTQEADLYATIQTFQTTIGRQL